MVLCNGFTDQLSKVLMNFKLTFIIIIFCSSVTAVQKPRGK